MEEYVSQILNNLGIKNFQRYKYGGHEIDIYFELNKQKIGVECKQYEKVPLDVIGLLDKWHSRQSRIGLDKVIIVIWGKELREREHELASHYNITLIDKPGLLEINRRSIEAGQGYLPEFVHKYIGISSDEFVKISNKHKKLKISITIIFIIIELYLVLNILILPTTDIAGQLMGYPFIILSILVIFLIYAYVMNKFDKNHLSVRIAYIFGRIIEGLVDFINTISNSSGAYRRTYYRKRRRKRYDNPFEARLLRNDEYFGKSKK